MIKIGLGERDHDYTSQMSETISRLYFCDDYKLASLSLHYGFTHSPSTVSA